MTYQPQAILVFYLIITFSYIFTRGFYSIGSFISLLFGLILFFIYFFKPQIISKKITTVSFDSVAILTFVTSVLFSVILYGGLYQQRGLLYTTSIYLFAISLFISISYFFDVNKYLNTIIRFRFRLLFTIAILTQIFMIISSPHPKIDVFDQLKLGSEGLLREENPYSQIYPQIYSYSQDYFPYLPLTALIVLPFNIILGDPRFTLIAANLLVVYVLRQILKESGNSLAYELIPLIYLFHPQMTFMIEQAWIDPLIFATFAAFIYSVMDKKRGIISTLLLGIAISLKQTFILLLPFLYLYKKIPRKILFGSVIVLIISVTPFLLWDSTNFIKDVVMNHFERRFWWHNSLTFNSFFFSEFKKNINQAIYFVVWIGLLVGIIKKGIVDFATLTLAISLWLLTFYLFNYQAYIHY